MAKSDDGARSFRRYDPLLPMVFQGEEISVGMRSWSHGYDFYAPLRSAIFHECDGGRFRFNLVARRG